MHSIKDIRKNPDYFKEKISLRNVKIDFKKIINLDKKNRELIQKKEKFEQEKKLLSKTKNTKNFEKSKTLTKQIDNIHNESFEISKKLKELLSYIPNIALNDVPIGNNETSNKLIRKSGNIRNFDFDLKSHTELGLKNNSLDFDTASKLSGSRFVILKDKIALLERALINFMLDIHTLKFGYKEVSPPLIVNEDIMFGTGQLPKFTEDQYELKKNDMKSERKYLIPTAEVSLTNLFRDSIIDSKFLPLRFVAATHCFRKEAGSYGKDTKGLMRQHQFYKVELVSLIDPINRDQELERMVDCAEEILRLLKIPHQVNLLSTGDMGFSSEKTYDIEAWIPHEKKYREISSCSSCGSFQARRMNTKFKKNGKTDFVTTLNGSGVAVGRLMIAIMENYQNNDGSINIPSELKKYMNNLDKI